MNARIIYIIGVSGCGKTTIGNIVAEKTGLSFFDGDHFHPASNIEKMKAGKALTDEDRKEWLQELNTIAHKQLKEKTGAVIGCSALKEKYRKILSGDIKSPVSWVYLCGDYDSISERLLQRKEHFMSHDLLQSQFDTLEAPAYGLHINIKQNPAEIAKHIMEYLEL
ncbi:MAG: gluconokinase [Balneolaceae bacterium]